MPNNVDIAMAWKANIHRKVFAPKSPCVFHTFTLHLGYEKKVTPARRKLVRKTGQTVSKRARLKFDNENASCQFRNNCIMLDRPPLTECTENTNPFALTCQSNVATAFCRSVSTQWCEEDIYGRNDHAYSLQGSDSQIKSTSTQTFHASFEEKGVQCSLESGAMSSKKITTDADSLFYTVVTLQVFICLVSIMDKLNKFPGGMETGDHVLIVLMRLKLNLLFEDLAKRFKISRSLVSRIYNDWLPLLAETLKNLVVWLPRETIQACLPAVFKTNYPKTTCILDCAETFIQRPKSLKRRSETYSQYKSHNTSKYLVAIAPHGQIMFISRAYGGRAIEKFIVKDPGILNYLLPGDELMADRGFTIDDLLFPLRVKLNIPSFTRGKDQLSEQDVTLTRRIASVRIHVERAIRRLKVFKILQSTAAVSSLKHFDDILVVCTALVNLRSDLIRDNIDVS